MNISPKLFRLTAELCGLDIIGRVEVYNQCLKLLRMAENRLNGSHDYFDDNDGFVDSSIYEGALQILSELKRLNVSDKTINHITICGFSPILFYFAANSETACNGKLLDEYRSKMHSCYEEKRFSAVTYGHFLKAAKLISDVNTHDDKSLCGTFRHNAVSLERARRRLNNHNEHLLSLYIEKIREYRSLADRTIKGSSCCIRAFLHCLEKRGIRSVDEYTHIGINDSITDIASWYDGGLRHVIYSIVQFLRFLHEDGITKTDFSLAIPKTPPKRRKIYRGFSVLEQNEILDTIDSDCPKGKRDFAIMLLAASTGLRAVDIANLKLEDIDWRTYEIKIVQSKTKNPLSLPLMPAPGNAIADYLLNARPESESRHVFTYHKRGGQLQGQTVGAVVKKYANLSGIGKKYERIGIHNFRRGFGINLLESEIPIDMINELFGHFDINSSRPYLAIDESGLKTCAISLSHICDDNPHYSYAGGAQ